jgi:putative DNA primase/helicase
MTTQLESWALALGGKVSGRNSVSAPGPGHSTKDRSLSVTFEPKAPDGFVVCSYSGDDFSICRDFVIERLGGKIDPPVAESRQARDNVNIDRARAIWREAVEIKWSLAAVHLARRCLSLDDELARPGLLRFHPACPFGKDRAPAMIALMRDVDSNEPRCIQRTCLSADGHKIDRLMLGPAKGAAIKIDPDSCVTNGLSIAEGLETALSGRAYGFRPAWALGSAGAIAAFPVLAGIERLNIFGEIDSRKTNERSVYECAERWIRAGREVHVLWPETGKDLNDEWMAKNAVDLESFHASVQGLWPGAAPIEAEEVRFRKELMDLRAWNARAYGRPRHAD